MNERRKAYPNELFHAVNSPYDYRKKRVTDDSSNARRINRTSVRRINSASDYNKMKYDQSRINAEIAFGENKDKRRFHDLLNRALSQANATEASIIKSTSQALAKFAAECRQKIMNKRSNFESGYKAEMAKIRNMSESNENARLKKKMQ